jgi:ParB/RepB/Spo0J family partition protein
VSVEQPDVIRVPIDKVHPNPWNPNTVPESIMSALRANVKRAGFNQPVLVRPHPTKQGEYEIVDGEHRWTVLRDDGATEIDVIVRDMSEAEAKAQTVAMNKLRGEMDPADVARLVRDIEGEIDLSELAGFSGYSEVELQGLTTLLDFDWSKFGDADPANDPQDDDEKWATLSYRVPASVEAIVTSEIERLKGLLDTEHEHLALEAMAVSSAQTTPEEVA